MANKYNNSYVMEYFRDRNIKPQKIVWEYPDILEMTDKDGNIHTYSIIELLDGLTAIAKQTGVINTRTKGLSDDL